MQWVVPLFVDMNRFRWILPLLWVWTACGTGEPPEVPAREDSTVNPTYTKVSPDFNQDSAFSYVERQCQFGPRNPGSPGHAACANWMLQKLKQYCPNAKILSYEVTTFDGKKFTAQNILASFLPEKKRRILLAAHWDSRPFADQGQTDQDKPIEAANDGGSGVGVLIEIARQLQLKQPDIGVDILLFDMEDYGQPQNSKFPEMADSYCLGSQAWAKNPHVAGYSPYMGILLDMVGAPGAKFAQEGTSLNQAPHTVQKIWETANKLGYPNFIYYQKDPIIDDHYYVNKYLKIPMADIIEYDPSMPAGFSKTWHTHGDVLSNISKETLKSVGQTVMEIIYTEN